MTTGRFHGAFTALVTPFKNGKIDEEAYREFIEWQIEQGIDGLVPCGTTGESATMTHDEHEAAIRICVEQVNKRVPVIAGAGSNNTREAIPLTQFAKNVGADAALHITPYYNKPTQEGLYLHFKAIAESVPGTPMLLYNNPGRVGYTLTADLVDALAHQVENIVGMKDTSGDITLTAEFIRRTRDVGFKVFGGKDTLLYASLCHGAVGGVCTAANFMPELITDVYNKFAAGDLQGSLEAQFKLNPVRLAMDPASFPVAAKDMAALRGRDVGAPYRPSLPTPEGPAKEGFRRTMSEAGLI